MLFVQLEIQWNFCNVTYIETCCNIISFIEVSGPLHSRGNRQHSMDASCAWLNDNYLSTCDMTITYEIAARINTKARKWFTKMSLPSFLLTSRATITVVAIRNPARAEKRRDYRFRPNDTLWYRCLARGRRLLEMAPWMLRDYHIHHPGRKCVLEILRKERMANPFSPKMIFPLVRIATSGSSRGIGHWRMGSWELAHLLVKLHQCIGNRNRGHRIEMRSTPFIRDLIIKKTYVICQIFWYRFFETIY